MTLNKFTGCLAMLFFNYEIVVSHLEHDSVTESRADDSNKPKSSTLSSHLSNFWSWCISWQNILITNCSQAILYISTWWLLNHWNEWSHWICSHPLYSDRWNKVLVKIVHNFQKNLLLKGKQFSYGINYNIWTQVLII